MTRREALVAILLSPTVAVRGSFAQTADLTALTIAQAAARLAARDLTTLQLTNAYLDRIATLNPSLNAFVTITADLARRHAKGLGEPNGPMFGIPIAHKDLFETRGVRTTAGSLLFEDNVPDQNATLVQQLEDAGAIMLGKTNTHELGGGVTTINPFFGATRNPVDQSRIPGGSSGGSAAAVAARLCAAATGSDTGGSVRIPAAFCGCVGFKPTYGRISTHGLIAASPTFDHIGLLTRTVEDVEIMFRVAVPGGRAMSVITPSRVGVPRNYFFDDLDPAVSAAIDDLHKRLGDTHRFRDIDFPIDGKTMARVFDPVFSFEMWGRFGADWRTNPGSFSKDLAAFFATPRPSIAEYEDGLASLKEYQASVDKLFDAVDVILTPTVPIVAPPINAPVDGMTILRNTWPFNAAGTPAISIPARTAVKLPVGIQLIAKRNNDDALLQVARSLG